MVAASTEIFLHVFYQIEDEMRERMENTLLNQYGYSVAYSEENQKVTDAWDLMQTKVCNVMLTVNEQLGQYLLMFQV